MPSRYLLDGGPVTGPVQTEAVSHDGRVWTISIEHANCACQWCAKIDAPAVEHVYERRDDDLFVYRESKAAVPDAVHGL